MAPTADAGGVAEDGTSDASALMSRVRALDTGHVHQGIRCARKSTDRRSSYSNSTSDQPSWLRISVGSGGGRRWSISCLNHSRTRSLLGFDDLTTASSLRFAAVTRIYYCVGRISFFAICHRCGENRLACAEKATGPTLPFLGL